MERVQNCQTMTAPVTYHTPPEDCDNEDCMWVNQCPSTCSRLQQAITPAPVEYWIGGDVMTMSRGE